MIHRVFIDWTRPLLPAVVQSLIEGHALPIDLSRTIVVVAGKRAGRRFRELLTEQTGGRHTPPRIVTVGDLPELLYEPQFPFASDLDQRLAWITAIRSFDATRLDPVIRRLPDGEDTDGWFALAELLWRQHRELLADGLRFSDVLHRADAVEAFGEHARWETLAAIQDAYLRTLDELGLWDLQTARQVALERHEFRASGPIVLVGMSDLTRIQRAMLEQLSEPVTACIHAPESLANAFDDHGCVIPERWEAMPIPLRDDQLVVADGPADAGGCVAGTIARLSGRFRYDEISIGLADESAAPFVVRRLHECGVSARRSVGPLVTRTPPVQLLSALADYLDDDSTATFTALVRHCDIGDWLTTREVRAGWLPKLDLFVQERAPRRIRDWSSHPDAVLWRPVCDAVDALVAPLKGRPRPLHEWAAILVQTLRTVYEQAQFDPEQPDSQLIFSSFDQLQTALDELEKVPATLALRTSAATAIRLVLRLLAGATAPPPRAEDAIEVMGWLDIAHDDAPATIVVGLNEGLIPQSMNADPFLPDRLRSALGVTDNLRRYARDAHALLTLLHSCEHSVLIAARRDSRGDPLAPSRLLFTGDALDTARRLRGFYRSLPTSPAVDPPPAAHSERFAFTVPRPPAEVPPPTVLAVTAFRDYLASPYRFYLKHVLRLRNVDDAVDELSAAAFGNLAHLVLGRFGVSDIKDSLDDREIFAFLSSTLDHVAREAYGEQPMMAVEIQIEQARTRLRAFAEWQAGWARGGWRIAFTEAPDEQEGVLLTLPDELTVNVRGRIDRIDRHADGRWIIFDYKTGEGSKSIEDAHRDDGEWIDLQLPLYRHLARSLGVSGRVQLGYVRLPRDASRVGEELATWTDDDLASADEAIRQVVLGIRESRYWEVLESEPGVLGEYGPICQDGVMNREVVV
ncbi:MAG: PD-(D/E)XK nuclease family protein [Planctomycetaceae bacterium]|nr:PD-(D/E)XK nuclease family protein [Planctomycetaceae bacterium]